MVGGRGSCVRARGRRGGDLLALARRRVPAVRRRHPPGPLGLPPCRRPEPPPFCGTSSTDRAPTATCFEMGRPPGSRSAAACLALGDNARATVPRCASSSSPPPLRAPHCLQLLLPPFLRHPRHPLHPSLPPSLVRLVLRRRPPRALLTCAAHATRLPPHPGAAIPWAIHGETCGESRAPATALAPSHPVPHADRGFSLGRYRA